jgi:NAD(P)-dependent dehydrogenase (short-subunit alcohol dehydrogenase family)
VNLTAPFLLSKLVFPRMRQAGGGIVVNVFSVVGRRGWAGAPAYCAAKFGLTGLTQALAAEGGAARHPGRLPLPGCDGNQLGGRDPASRAETTSSPAEDALPPQAVADYHRLAGHGTLRTWWSPRPW